jgi:hypothetical protein
VRIYQTPGVGPRLLSTPYQERRLWYNVQTQPTGDRESEAHMATHDTVAPPRNIYPESDGQPMADTTLQFRWIFTVQGGIAAPGIEPGQR